MQFTELTTASKKVHTLNHPEKKVFFLHNLSDDVTFELNAPSAEAYIFALFTGKENDDFQLKINQIHNAPKTTSHVLVKFLGQDKSSLKYEGLIRIGKEAVGCESSQKNINLMLSDDAQAFSFPSLEILTDDVICHHGSTTSRVNKDHIFYAQSRGITLEDAEQMLADGFMNDFFSEIEKLGHSSEIEYYKSKLVKLKA